MSHKRKPRVGSAGPIENSVHTENNKAASRKSQASPWANAPVYDPWADVIQRWRADADRLEATSEDDRRWFEANPGRDFHIREATPHERHVGQSDSAILVVRLPNIGRARFSIEVYRGEASDYDTDAIGEILFAAAVRRADPDLREIILRTRGRAS